MRKIFGLSFLAAVLFFQSPALYAVESPYSGNFIVPENQSGFKEEAYEGAVVGKLERGVKNFFLGFLEIPHGIKGEYEYRKQQYLPGNLEALFIGAFKGLLNAGGRMAVGLYEGFTFPYPQEPILPEMEEWLY